MKKLLLLFMVTISTNAMSGILIDPFIGYSTGDTSGDASNDFSGTEVGARAAYSFLGLYAGVDYRIRNYDVDGSNNIEDNSRVALVAGYEFPILVRAFATYGIISGMKAGSKELEISKDMTIGVGYTGLPLLAINFEMSNFNVSKIDNIDTDIDYNMYLFSVSLPLSF